MNHNTEVSYVQKANNAHGVWNGRCNTCGCTWMTGSEPVRKCPAENAEPVDPAAKIATLEECNASLLKRNQQLDVALGVSRENYAAVCESLRTLNITLVDLNVRLSNAEAAADTLREARDTAVRERDECLEKLASLASGWKAEHERIRAEMRETSQARLRSRGGSWLRLVSSRLS